MTAHFIKNSFIGERYRILVIAKFKTEPESAGGQVALEALFDDIAQATAALFKKKGGRVEASEITKIYAKQGLRNDTGWEQEYPIQTKGKELAWILAPGAYAEDAQNLLFMLGATQVAVHQLSTAQEEWRFMPHPTILMMNMGEEGYAREDMDEDDTISLTTAHKRTLH